MLAKKYEKKSRNSYPPRPQHESTPQKKASLKNYVIKLFFFELTIFLKLIYNPEFFFHILLHFTKSHQLSKFLNLQAGVIVMTCIAGAVLNIYNPIRRLFDGTIFH